MVISTKKRRQDENSKTDMDRSLKLIVYFLGIISLVGSIVAAIYEVYDKIFVKESIIPESSFVFSIACIIFCIVLIAGCHKERLDYLTPYFITAVILTGYFTAVILLDISKWNFVKYPKTTLLWSTLGLIVTVASCVILFKFMERLKLKFGIRSTWERMKAYSSSAQESGYDTD